VRCHDATVSSFAAKVLGEVFACFHAVAVRHSSMWSWLFGLPGRIVCGQSPWYQSKWWACSWLCSSPVSSFSVSASLDFPYAAHAFFPECLFNHCQGLLHFFPDLHIIWFVSLLDPSRNHIRPDTGRKKSACLPSCVKFCTLTPKIC
jgi:hypothetical protein